MPNCVTILISGILNNFLTVKTMEMLIFTKNNTIHNILGVHFKTFS